MVRVTGTLVTKAILVVVLSSTVLQTAALGVPLVFPVRVSSLS
jgi:hypothetical protein